MPVTLVSGKEKQEDEKLKASLNYVVSLRIAWAMGINKYANSSLGLQNKYKTSEAECPLVWSNLPLSTD